MFSPLPSKLPFYTLFRKVVTVVNAQFRPFGQSQEVSTVQRFSCNFTDAPHFGARHSGRAVRSHGAQMLVGCGSRTALRQCQATLQTGIYLLEQVGICWNMLEYFKNQCWIPSPLFGKTLVHPNSSEMKPRTTSGSISTM